MSYITQSDLEDKQGTELTAEQAEYFTNTLEPAIAQYIEEQTGTVFENSTESEVFVDGNDSKMLIIPTMSAIESVHSVDEDGTETLIEGSAYSVYPRSGPILAVRNKSGTWSEGFENYKITGKVGYADVPGAIKAIALELATLDIGSNLNGYKSEKVGDWSVTYGDNTSTQLPSSSLATLQGYRRLSRSV